MPHVLQKEFGFCPKPIKIIVESVRICPLPDFENIVAEVRHSSRVDKDWIYAPPMKEKDIFSDSVRQLPYPSRVFDLPMTHTIEHSRATSEAHLDFIVWALSFFNGMRFSPTTFGFLDATPLKVGALVDFILKDRSLKHALELAESFWRANECEPRHTKRFEAAVNALFLGQNPQSLDYEKFLCLYIALDACYKLAEALRGPPNQDSSGHYNRIKWVCNQFGVCTPNWAQTEPSSTKTILSEIRNDTIHEALFIDAPLGFKTTAGSNNDNLIVEMSALVCRILVALIGGEEADYVRSPVNTENKFPLKLV